MAGGALVVAAWASVIGTMVVPRRGGWLTRWTDRIVDRAFRAFIVAAGADADYRRRDRVLVAQGVTILIVQFVAWLGGSFIGFTLLLWPFVTGGITQAFAVAGGAMTTLGFSGPAGTIPPAIVFAAAWSSLVIVAPQIAYLPALYAAYNRRETEVSLLNARAGEPSWGPELLARTHLALGSGSVSAIGSLPDLYAQWERWAIDVAEGHGAYLPLVRFRSSQRLASWVTALLAVLDSAALFIALSPQSAPLVPARLCLRAGYICFTKSARAMGIPVPAEPEPGPASHPSRRRGWPSCAGWVRAGAEHGFVAEKLIDRGDGRRQAGGRVIQLSTADQREWDDFESTSRAVAAGVLRPVCLTAGSGSRGLRALSPARPLPPPRRRRWPAPRQSPGSRGARRSRRPGRCRDQRAR